MAFTATTNLNLPIITTGTESGTWGDLIDNGLTSYLDIAIAGGLAITVTTANVTLTNTSGTSGATGITSTTAQYAMLNVSGAMTAARNLIVPSSSKSYIVNNNTTGGFALTVKGASTSGVTLVNGEKALIAWNGADFVKVANQNGEGVFTSLTSPAATALLIQSAGTTAMTVDTSQNVGLGVTPSTWSGGGLKAMEFVANGNALSGNGTTMYLTSNCYYNGAWKYGYTGAAGQYYINGNSHNWAIASAGTAGNPITFTQAMTLDASGSLGVGTSSPIAKLQVSGTASGATIRSRVDNLATGANTTADLIINTGAANSYTQLQTVIGGGGSLNFGSDLTSGAVAVLGAYPLIFNTNNAERMRIDANGRLYVGTTGSNTQQLTVNRSFMLTGDTASNTVSSDGFWLTKDGGTTYNGFHIQPNTSWGADFYIGNTSSTWIKAMTLDTSGNLAVSTSVSVGGVAVPTISSTSTLTNKWIQPRVLASTANSATPTLNTDSYDMLVITGQSVAITSFTTNLTGTPVNGQKLWISITGTGAIALTWGASFESSTAALPTTTVTTARLDVGFVWNVATTKWRCVAVA